MPAYRYWRLNATTTAREVAYSEITMRATVGGANIATGGTATESAFFPGFPASNAFDGNVSSLYGSGVAAPQWVQYDFGSAVDVVQYDIRPRNDANTNNDSPTVFNLQGSNDGSTFTTVDSRTVLAADWGGGFAVGPRTFFIGNVDTAQAAYRYWRLKLWSAKDSFGAVTKLVLRETAGGADATGGGTPTAQTVFSGTFSADKAFDGDGASFWASLDGLPQWLKYDFGSAKIIREYSITPRPSPSHQNQGPLAWTLEASTDDSTWVIRDARNSDSTSWADGVARTFTPVNVVAATGAYRRRFADIIG